MRPDTMIRPIPEYNVMVTRGGLGDTIARLPAIKYMLDTYKNVEVIKFYCQNHCVEIVKHLFKEYGERLKVFNYDQMRDEVKESVPGIMTDNKHHTTLRTHLTDHAFHTLCDWTPSASDYKNYLKLNTTDIDLSAFNLPEKFVVITTGFTSGVREWLPGEVNKLIQLVKQDGYDIVFLGQRQSTYSSTIGPIKGVFREEIDYDQGLNLVDQTTLLQAAAILSKAQAVFGVDNGLLHLAALSDTLIIAGYTTVPPRFRLPYRYGELGWNCYIVTPDEQQLPCTFCQEKLQLLFNFDLRNCYYNDYECVKQMKGESFYKEFKRANSRQD